MEALAVTVYPIEAQARHSVPRRSFISFFPVPPFSLYRQL